MNFHLHSLKTQANNVNCWIVIITLAYMDWGLCVPESRLNSLQKSAPFVFIANIWERRIVLNLFGLLFGSCSCARVGVWMYMCAHVHACVCTHVRVLQACEDERIFIHACMCRGQSILRSRLLSLAMDKQWLSVNWLLQKQTLVACVVQFRAYHTC